MKITKIENPDDRQVLSQVAADVQFPLSASIQKFIVTLKQQHDVCGGVGLAAPQIGEALKIFVIEITEDQAYLRKDGKNRSIAKTVYINPSYRGIETKGKNADVEGCFSVDSVAGWVPRYNEIEFNAYQENGERVFFIANGFFARVLQHETDHVYGILIKDKLTPECRQGTPQEVYAMRIAEMTAEERERLARIQSTPKKS